MLYVLSVLYGAPDDELSQELRLESMS